MIREFVEGVADGFKSGLQTFTPSDECTVDPHHRVDIVAAVVSPEYDYPWRIDYDKTEKAERNPPSTNGSGHLEEDGWEVIQNQIDPDDLDEETHVADIVVDLTLWSCCVRWTDAGEELRDGGKR